MAGELEISFVVRCLFVRVAVAVLRHRGLLCMFERVFQLVAIVQLVRTPDCGSGGRRFESG